MTMEERIVKIMAFLIKHNKAISKTIFWSSGILLAVI